MVVRLLVPIAGVGFSLGPGDPYECDDASAARLVAAGIAAPVDPPPADVETAMAPGARERAMRSRGKARG